MKMWHWEVQGFSSTFWRKTSVKFLNSLPPILSLCPSASSFFRRPLSTTVSVPASCTDRTFFGQVQILASVFGTRSLLLDLALACEYSRNILNPRNHARASSSSQGLFETRVWIQGALCCYSGGEGCC